MNVLIACEESQRVCAAFRERGHNAFSCDIQEPSGGHPEWHILGDALKILNPDIQTLHGTQYYGIYFRTMDGLPHRIKKGWDMIIAHPPCTYLSVSGNRWLDIEKYGEKAIKRHEKRECAIDFFMNFVNAICFRIAIENPVGCMSTRYRKPDQIIQPYQFGHPYTKQTCLWLKNLPRLEPTNILTKPESGWENQQFTSDGRYGGFGGDFSKKNGKWLKYGDPHVARERSKTFPGIARAMAEQWG